jgi:hypothetical protein
VDDDLVMEPAQQDTALGAGLAAILLVLDVVDFTGGGGLIAAPGPPAVPVPEDDRVADARRDGGAVPDVQRQARPAQPDPELAAAQEAGQPAWAGEQVDGLRGGYLLA